uniref:Uncharacterized protein n=1 Tax=Panagrolaimus sp. ES5 TaxID=591445 RepID=A0AC34G6P4_9BILA
MVDMAEFYGVGCLKMFCDKFLSCMKKAAETLEEMFEFAQKYSLPKFTESIKSFFLGDTETVCNSEAFIAFTKPFIEFLITADNKTSDDETSDYEPYYMSYYMDVYPKEAEFEGVYKWAEHRVTVQKDAENETFDLLEAIKTELSTILPLIKFSKMSREFLINFVIEKGFFLSSDEMLHMYSDYAFESTYELAAKQALKKQEMFPEENFNLINSIKASLVKVIPQIKFFKMEKNFLMDFVVAKGIITEEQANHVFDTRVQIKNNDKTISASFNDDVLGIRAAVAKKKSCHVTRQNTTKIRFQTLKFKVPKTPSTVSKMKGCEWYLCLETDGILNFKHHSIVQKSDYLIAEMKSSEEFELTAGATTYLNACYNNVNFS